MVSSSLTPNFSQANDTTGVARLGRNPDDEKAATLPDALHFSGKRDSAKDDWGTILMAGKLLGTRKNLSRTFARLVSEWHSQRNPYSSDPAELAMCLAYQKIIAIGPEIVPFILSEMRTRPDHWFWALRVLADADPVKPEHRGLFDEMTKDWLDWGKANGYVFGQI